MPQTFKAGERAPADGLYRVTHYQHRLPHLVSAMGGTTLPQCLRCGDHVRFELIGPLDQDNDLNSDRDFITGTEG